MSEVSGKLASAIRKFIFTKCSNDAVKQETSPSRDDSNRNRHESRSFCYWHG